MMGAHVDDAELTQNKPIVSLSLGSSCVFLLGIYHPDDANNPNMPNNPIYIYKVGGIVRLLLMRFISTQVCIMVIRVIRVLMLLCKLRYILFMIVD